MKRKLVIGCFLLLSFASKAQYFNIKPIIADTINDSLFHYHVSGRASFNDSLILRVELIQVGEHPDTVYSGIYNFKNPTDSSLRLPIIRHQFVSHAIENSDSTELIDSLIFDSAVYTFPRLYNFTYLPEMSRFNFTIGDFPRSDLYLHMWLIQEGEIKDEMYYKQ